MYTYLLINLASIAIPFIYSFHPRLRFDRSWPALWPALLVTTAVFISWDIYFTEIGVWGFNPDYLLGIQLLGLPVEEWLFFICIPYACVFTYACLAILIRRDYLQPLVSYLTPLLAGVLLVTAIVHWDRLYTGITFSLTGLFLLWHQYVLKSQYLGRFYLAYGVILLPFFIVNGILTGSFIQDEVVWYNNSENLGIRLFTIPVEDVFYGMLLILMNVTVFEFLRSRKSRPR